MKSITSDLKKLLSNGSPIKNTIESREAAQKLVAKFISKQLKIDDGAIRDIGYEVWMPDLGGWIPLCVKCDQENNPPEVLNRKEIVVDVIPREILDTPICDIISRPRLPR
jgi:hypothetical protein